MLEGIESLQEYDRQVSFTIRAIVSKDLHRAYERRSNFEDYDKEEGVPNSGTFHNGPKSRFHTAFVEDHCASASVPSRSAP